MLSKATPSRHRHLAFASLLLVALVAGLAACGPRSAATPSRVVTETPTVAANPLSRIHNATPGDFLLFVRITFTPSTTYEQAVAILGQDPYPWTCDDPRTPVPPSPAEQAATFASSHTLIVESPAWDVLTRIAASPQVISVDGAALYQCP